MSSQVSAALTTSDFCTFARLREGLQARTGAKKAEDEESESGEKYDVYGMHRSSFVAGKLQARFMADNHRFLNVPAHLPQACQTYRAITEQVLQTCNR